MLASINPLGERARNQRYWVTVTAYIAASTGAGALLGGALGLAGAPVALPWVAVAGVGALAIAGIVCDARAAGARLPGPRRQVDENWLVTYRGWVYGSGFGAQLGFAFATIVTASATWVAFACALLAGSGWAGLAIGAIFGLTRALPLLAGARVRDSSSLRTLVGRLERLRRPVARATTAVQGTAAIGLLALALTRAG